MGSEMCIRDSDSTDCRKACWMFSKSVETSMFRCGTPNVFAICLSSDWFGRSCLCNFCSMSLKAAICSCIGVLCSSASPSPALYQTSALISDISWRPPRHPQDKIFNSDIDRYLIKAGGFTEGHRLGEQWVPAEWMIDIKADV